MKSKKLKSALSSVLIMTSLVNPIVTYAGDGDEPEKQSSTTASTKQHIEPIYLMNVARYMDARSKFKLKEVNKKCKDIVENMPADMPVEYLRTATKRIHHAPVLDIDKPDEADFFRDSTKFWSAKHNLTKYTTNVLKSDLEKFAQNNTHFKDIVNKILEIDTFDTSSSPAIYKPTELIELLVNEFEIKNPDYFKENETTKDNILNHIRGYYLIDECFYCPVGEKLTAAEEIDKIAMPVLKYIELFLSDFVACTRSRIFCKFFAQEPTITFDIANKYHPWDLSKNPQGTEHYERILAKHEIAKRVLSQWFGSLCICHMNLVILYEQEDFPEELKHLAIFFINVTEEIINAVLVEKNKNVSDIETVENIYKSDWMKEQHKTLKNMPKKRDTHSRLAENFILHFNALKRCVQDLKSGKYDQLIKYLNS